MCSFFHVHAPSVSHSDTDLLTVAVFQSEKVQLQINDFDLHNCEENNAVISQKKQKSFLEPMWVR